LYDDQQATILFEDNKPCIATSENPVTNDRLKHIDIKYHWIRKKVCDDSMKISNEKHQIRGISA
jgi:hypothetical protein